MQLGGGWGSNSWPESLAKTLDMFFRWDARVCSSLKSTHCAEGAFFLRATERKQVQAVNAVRGSPSSGQPLEEETGSSKVSVQERLASKNCGSGRLASRQPFGGKLGPSRVGVRERFATKIAAALPKPLRFEDRIGSKTEG